MQSPTDQLQPCSTSESGVKNQQPQCQVCFIRTVETVQPYLSMIVCVQCGKAAHLYCYQPSLDQSERKRFKCDVCQKNTDRKQVLMMKCCICGNVGLLKRVTQIMAESSMCLTDFAHPICLLFHPQVFVDSYQNFTFLWMLYTDSSEKSPKKIKGHNLAKKQNCKICNQSQGQLQKCFAQCKSYAHIYCAWKTAQSHQQYWNHNLVLADYSYQQLHRYALDIIINQINFSDFLIFSNEKKSIVGRNKSTSKPKSSKSSTKHLKSIRSSHSSSRSCQSFKSLSSQSLCLSSVSPLKKSPSSYCSRRYQIAQIAYPQVQFQFCCPAHTDCMFQCCWLEKFKQKQNIKFIQCDQCIRWYHMKCAFQNEKKYAKELQLQAQKDKRKISIHSKSKKKNKNKMLEKDFEQKSQKKYYSPIKSTKLTFSKQNSKYPNNFSSFPTASISSLNDLEQLDTYKCIACRRFIAEYESHVAEQNEQSKQNMLSVLEKMLPFAKHLTGADLSQSASNLPKGISQGSFENKQGQKIKDNSFKFPRINIAQCILINTILQAEISFSYSSTVNKQGSIPSESPAQWGQILHQLPIKPSIQYQIRMLFLKHFQSIQPQLMFKTLKEHLDSIQSAIPPSVPHTHLKGFQDPVLLQSSLLGLQKGQKQIEMLLLSKNLADHISQSSPFQWSFRSDILNIQKYSTFQANLFKFEFRFRDVMTRLISGLQEVLQALEDPKDFGLNLKNIERITGTIYTKLILTRQRMTQQNIQKTQKQHKKAQKKNKQKMTKLQKKNRRELKTLLKVKDHRQATGKTSQDEFKPLKRKHNRKRVQSQSQQSSLSKSSQKSMSASEISILRKRLKVYQQSFELSDKLKLQKSTQAMYYKQPKQQGQQTSSFQRQPDSHKFILATRVSTLLKIRLSQFTSQNQHILTAQVYSFKHLFKDTCEKPFTNIVNKVIELYKSKYQAEQHINDFQKQQTNQSREDQEQLFYQKLMQENIRTLITNQVAKVIQILRFVLFQQSTVAVAALKQKSSHSSSKQSTLSSFKSMQIILIAQIVSSKEFKINIIQRLILFIKCYQIKLREQTTTAEKIREKISKGGKISSQKQKNQNDDDHDDDDICLSSSTAQVISMHSMQIFPYVQYLQYFLFGSNRMLSLDHKQTIDKSQQNKDNDKSSQKHFFHEGQESQQSSKFYDYSKHFGLRIPSQSKLKFLQLERLLLETKSYYSDKEYQHSQHNSKTKTKTITITDLLNDSLLIKKVQRIQWLKKYLFSFHTGQDDQSRRHSLINYYQKHQTTQKTHQPLNEKIKMTTIIYQALKQQLLQFDLFIMAQSTSSLKRPNLLDNKLTYMDNNFTNNNNNNILINSIQILIKTFKQLKLTKLEYQKLKMTTKINQQKCNKQIKADDQGKILKQKSSQNDEKNHFTNIYTVVVNRLKHILIQSWLEFYDNFEGLLNMLNAEATYKNEDVESFQQAQAVVEVQDKLHIFVKSFPGNNMTKSLFRHTIVFFTSVNKLRKQVNNNFQTKLQTITTDLQHSNQWASNNEVLEQLLQNLFFSFKGIKLPLLNDQFEEDLQTLAIICLKHASKKQNLELLLNSEERFFNMVKSLSRMYYVGGKSKEMKKSNMQLQQKKEQNIINNQKCQNPPDPDFAPTPTPNSEQNIQKLLLIFQEYDFHEKNVQQIKDLNNQNRLSFDLEPYKIFEFQDKLKQMAKFYSKHNMSFKYLKLKLLRTWFSIYHAFLKYASPLALFPEKYSQSSERSPQHFKDKIVVFGQQQERYDCSLKCKQEEEEQVAAQKSKQRILPNTQYHFLSSIKIPFHHLQTLIECMSRTHFPKDSQFSKNIIERLYKPAAMLNEKISKFFKIREQCLDMSYFLRRKYDELLQAIKRHMQKVKTGKTQEQMCSFQTLIPLIFQKVYLLGCSPQKPSEMEAALIKNNSKEFSAKPPLASCTSSQLVQQLLYQLQQIGIRYRDSPTGLTRYNIKMLHELMGDMSPKSSTKWVNFSLQFSQINSIISQSTSIFKKCQSAKVLTHDHIIQLFMKLSIQLTRSPIQFQELQLFCSFILGYISHQNSKAAQTKEPNCKVSQIQTKTNPRNKLQQSSSSNYQQYESLSYSSQQLLSKRKRAQNLSASSAFKNKQSLKPLTSQSYILENLTTIHSTYKDILNKIYLINKKCQQQQIHISAFKQPLIQQIYLDDIKKQFKKAQIFFRENGIFHTNHHINQIKHYDRSAAEEDMGAVYADFYSRIIIYQEKISMEINQVWRVVEELRQKGFLKEEDIHQMEKQKECYLKEQNEKKQIFLTPTPTSVKQQEKHLIVYHVLNQELLISLIQRYHSQNIKSVQVEELIEKYNDFRSLKSKRKCSIEKLSQSIQKIDKLPDIFRNTQETQKRKQQFTQTLERLLQMSEVNHHHHWLQKQQDVVTNKKSKILMNVGKSSTSTSTVNNFISNKDYI